MEKYWIWFKLLDINYEKKIKLIKGYKDIVKIYNLTNDILKNEFDFNDADVKIFNNKFYKIKAEEVYQYNKEREIKVLNILDKNYPYLLKKIYNPPIVLYYLGNVILLNKKCLTIFQGLNITEYGIKLIKYISDNISSNNVAIVSRMIKTDKYIYRNCKNSIMILSRGINEKFFLKSGLILSEYEYYIENSKNNVIERNRILTGMSKEIVVIQANIKDGVGYIVDFALEQNRELVAFPSNIFEIENTYTNELIKQGVKIITNYMDLEVYEQIKNNENM